VKLFSTNVISSIAHINILTSGRVKYMLCFHVCAIIELNGNNYWQVNSFFQTLFLDCSW